MNNNVVALRSFRRAERLSVSPAQFYRFSGEPTDSLINEPFLEKAAAFQEIRDCLIAADDNKLSAYEAERRIQYFIRAYLGLD